MMMVEAGNDAQCSAVSEVVQTTPILDDFRQVQEWQFSSLREQR
jgi:hypothetical protein